MQSKRLIEKGVDFPYLIAPMVGISHVAFRELIRIYTPKKVLPFLFTEMLSTKRVPNERLEYAEYLKTAEYEKNLIPQLLGNDEILIKDSIEKLNAFNPFAYDINMGCPVAQTLKHNWGVQLMGDSDYAAKVVQMAVKYSRVPVSVKMRASIGREISVDYLFKFTEKLEKAGASWLTIHARSKEQGHHGKADWDLLTRVAKERGIPIIANGDIQTRTDAKKLLTQYHVDGVMIGRAATARPWILWQILYEADPQNIERPPLTPDEEGKEYFQACLIFIFLLKKYFGETPESFKKLRFFVSLSHHWLLFGHHLWRAFQKTKNLSEAEAMFEKYREENPMPLHARINQ